MTPNVIVDGPLVLDRTGKILGQMRGRLPVMGRGVTVPLPPEVTPFAEDHPRGFSLDALMDWREHKEHEWVLELRTDTVDVRKGLSRSAGFKVLW